jgi:hypothetical protein
MPNHGKVRLGFTLMEVLLALGLTVIITVLVGGLIRIYMLQVEVGEEQVRQALVAEKLLNAIADDIRSVSRFQPYDTGPLQEILANSASSALGGMGGMPGGMPSGGGPSGGSSGGPSGPSTPNANPSSLSTPPTTTSGPAMTQNPQINSGGGQSRGSTGSPMSMSSSSPPGATGGSVVEAGTDAMQGPLPPGLYGSETELRLDVSRLPRPDQYFGEAPDLISGRMTDIPSDTKTVTYVIQVDSAYGVIDPLANPAAVNASQKGGSGLVRRQLDRALTLWAQQQGQSDSLNRTGELIASEVLGIEFGYYDGTQWWTTWDSSQQGLPWIVQVRLAMQNPRIARTNPMTPGLMINSLDAAQRAEFGISIYEVMVPIPGVQLLNAAQAGASTSGGGDSGMSSVGL